MVFVTESALLSFANPTNCKADFQTTRMTSLGPISYQIRHPPPSLQFDLYYQPRWGAHQLKLCFSTDHGSYNYHRTFDFSSVNEGAYAGRQLLACFNKCTNKSAHD